LRILAGIEHSVESGHGLVCDGHISTGRTGGEPANHQPDDNFLHFSDSPCARRCCRIAGGKTICFGRFGAICARSSADAHAAYRLVTFPESL
jgi:hypothetical protein